MLMYPAWALREMRRIGEASDVLFIADEVMTVWGRTGTLFACEQANVTPDIACYSKGLTGGALPLAVTLCRADIFNAHYSKDRTRTFFHSSS
ncbi:adenosylmethionine-8-amino-7-oxononanoate aminotransferase [Bradyrhizobium centrosematis]|nr:adenosylmethionine-8-amino-7-oxononanoate aminotransferase [Bradyrhizobium centrosematis]MCS3778287.1 adenosylmethionine-8-amino-7-oxononanoate aminotransferase [Bradyrhizobium centrosematis]